MNYGVIHGEDSASYHATDAVGSHKLADFARPNVPLLFFRRYVSKEAPAPERGEGMAFGEYFHCLTLEGETVADARFAVVPDSAPDRPTAAMLTAKKPSESSIARVQWWADWDKANAGKAVVSTTDHSLAWRMVEAIRAKPIAKTLFDHGKPEVTFRHKLASFSVQARCDWFDERPDAYRRPTIIDVKTIDRLSNFDRQFLKYGYYRQAAFYQMVTLETLNLPGAWPRFLFVVAEKQEPFQVEVRAPDEISLDIGRQEVKRDLERLKHCYDTDTWPGSPDEIIPVELPEKMTMKTVA